nr:bifunctional proline dehydrogenase/L-glutamate gamma-semialdehyde dehydrogenase PutA [Alysiella crassa]UOP06417.1 bifunctional proline dehydrogenase/L-glutamate gamma-semialdehyde dehydrogenase PutA [Alysiella crassa]
MFHFAHPIQSPLRQAITAAYRRDELDAVQDMLQQARMTEDEQAAATELAKKLVSQVRENRTKSSGVDALMHEFSLSSEEGVALMCLAEALLRIPDTATRDKLIQDKLAHGDWHSHLGQSPSLFVNAAAWGLLITGKLTTAPSSETLSGSLNRVLNKGGAPLIRAGVDYGMRMLGKQFVTGQTIEEALKNGKEREQMGYRYSFDMLGEAAMTAADAERYYQDYVNAIHAIGKDSQNAGVYDGNGISVKLSAIHPRYSRAQHERVMTELLPKLKQLYVLAKQYNIGLNIDAEEANRLELSLDLMEKLVADPDLAGYKGIGFVVQAYQKRCPFVIDYLIDLARKNNQKLMIRLVKGAYWDSEIKWAQVDGLDDYPVYTRKVHTDVSYLACARKLLDAQDAVFPQFATHNAYTLAAIYQMGKGKEFEHQCLHGMGETLYDQVVGEHNLGRRVRIYAPVGTHETLLAYLVRRLLENGANTSFVNQIVDENIGIDDLIRSPFDTLANDGIRRHSALPMPKNLYGTARVNSKGIDLSNEHSLQSLEQAMNFATRQPFQAACVVNGETRTINAAQPVRNPANHDDVVGTVSFGNADLAREAIGVAVAAQAKWSNTPAQTRAGCLNRFADLLETNYATLMMLAVREAGKTLNNAIAEIREAVDFARYYAAESVNTLPENSQGAGVMVAISPWNFPLAIFVGEITAALAAGNAVVAKPAEQTSLIAHFAVKLLHEAGVPKDVLQLVLGAGDVGAALTQDTRIGGVIFTGSTEVARLINQTLAQRSDNPVLIAETGGQNAMIVDSTALPEQVVADVLNSAFDSAGQRCSALRVLCLQEEIADKFIDMIQGAMNELCVGDTRALTADVGAVIDAEAQQNLLNHINKMKTRAKAFHEIRLPENADNATFVAPIMFELNDLNDLEREVFEPVLHIVRYRAENLDNLIQQINSKGYALTHGIHSRIDSTVNHIRNQIEAGNVYVNRNIVGAVVGVQPFGGHGLSGTGPKAGGVFYIQRLSQLPRWTLPKLTRLGAADESALAKVQAALHHLAVSPEEKLALAGKLGQARVYTLRGAEQLLPSCTGERNTATWHTPKHVYLHGGNLVNAFAALIELAAAGVETVVAADSPLAAYATDLSGLLRVSPQPLNEKSVQTLVALDNLPVDIKQTLAARDGAIVRVIDATIELDMAKVYLEQSCSVNTTAAGGNASLMAMGD